MNLPSVILFVNADGMNAELQANLQLQFFINEAISKIEFDARVAADPNYPSIVHLQGLRIMVVLPDYTDLTNRNLADVVLFLSGGMAYVEQSKFGPPGQAWDIQYIDVYEVLRAAKDMGCGMNLPAYMCGCRCSGPFRCDECRTFSGLRICGTCHNSCRCDCNPNYANQENEYSNTDFKNRTS
jgi:hypothetical protein